MPPQAAQELTYPSRPWPTLLAEPSRRKKKIKAPAGASSDRLVGPRTSSPTWALDGGGEHATLLDEELHRNAGGAMPMMMRMNLIPCTFVVH